MTESRTDIDRIITNCRRDSRTVSGSERRALCDEIERLRAIIREAAEELSCTCATYYTRRGLHEPNTHCRLGQELAAEAAREGKC